MERFLTTVIMLACLAIGALGYRSWETAREKNHMAELVRQEHARLEAANQLLAETQHKLSAEQELFHQQFTLLDQEKQKLQQAKAMLEGLKLSWHGDEDIDSLKAKMKTEQDTINGIQRQLNDLKSDNSYLNNFAKRAYNDQKSDSDFRQRSLASQIHDLDETIKSNQAQLNDLKRNHKFDSNFADEFSNLNEGIQNQKAQRLALKSERQTLQQRNRQANGDISLQVQDEKTDLNQNEQDLRAKLKTEQANYQVLKNELDQKQRAKQDHQQQLSSLQTTISSQAARVAQLQTSLNQTRSPGSAQISQ